ncbi:MAG: efflux RND transporter periplasmic adaptor subunit [Burkholderiaceae bacterium]|nr:efflux RND transporter periplasmic adaptor subunit [Burkholderiaceae bacterium]
MKSKATLVAVALGSVAGVPAIAHADGFDCLIQPHQIVQVGAPVPGVIESLPVERGDIVQKGEKLLQLHASVERAALKLARARAEVQAELEAAANSRAFAKRELDRANELASRKFVSQNYVDKASTEASLAKSKLGQARERQEVARKEFEVARAQLAQRTVVSPISGVIADRYMSVGEYVEDKPILRIAQIDPLRVEVVVPAAAYGKIKKGAQGTVMPEFGNAPPRLATITVVDRLVDPASNTFRVRLTMPNPDNDIPAGLRCKVDLGVSLPKPTRAPARPSPMKSAAQPVAKPKS